MNGQIHIEEKTSYMHHIANNTEKKLSKNIFI